MWIFIGLILLLTEMLHVEPGTNPNTSVSSSSPSPPLVHVRNSTFNLGSDVNLTCSNKTWNETMFVIWEIKLINTHKDCKIAFTTDGQSEDSCKDGKSLRNTSGAQSYLHIPNVSEDDEGIYNCEFVYRGGYENCEINVAIRVPPSISAWLEPKDKQMVAVCRAERGKPAANISWSHTGNTVETLLDKSNGFFTTESRLELLEGTDTENVTCAIKHPFWGEDQILVPKLKKGYVAWLSSLAAVIIVLFLGGVLFFAQRKFLLRRCHQSNSSQTKCAPMEDVEEVEPYASYVQRVNSLYNSSADLFT